jgi:hypothetical protein
MSMSLVQGTGFDYLIAIQIVQVDRYDPHPSLSRYLKKISLTIQVLSLVLLLQDHYCQKIHVTLLHLSFRLD